MQLHVPLIASAIIALLVGPVAGQSRVVVDVECHTTSGPGWSRVVCVDNSDDRSSTGSASTERPYVPEDPRIVAGRCEMVKKGARGVNIRGCPPTDLICSVAAAEKQFVSGCPGTTLDLSSNNALLGKALVSSKNPRLVIACVEGQLAASVWMYAPLEGRTTHPVRLKWDDAPPIAQPWSHSTDPRWGDAVTSPDPVAVAAGLEKASRLALEVTPKKSAPFVLYFRIGGSSLQEHLPLYRSRCRADSAAGPTK